MTYTKDKTKRIAKILSYAVLYIIFFCSAVSAVWLLMNDFSLVTVLYVLLPAYEIYLVVKNANLKTSTFKSIVLDLILPIISGYFYLFLGFLNIEYKREKGFDIRGAGIANIGDILIWAGYFLSFISIIYLRKYFTVFAEANGLIKSGPYKYVRNPIYTGYAISAIGGVIKYLSVKGIIISAVYYLLFIIRAVEEEKLLHEKFGQEYTNYKKSTGRFFPKIF